MVTNYNQVNITLNIIIIIIVKQKPICSYKAELLGLHHLKYDLWIYTLRIIIGIKRYYATWYIAIFKTIGIRPDICKIVIISKTIRTFVWEKIV